MRPAHSEPPVSSGAGPNAVHSAAWIVRGIVSASIVRKTTNEIARWGEMVKVGYDIECPSVGCAPAGVLALPLVLPRARPRTHARLGCLAVA